MLCPPWVPSSDTYQAHSWRSLIPHLLNSCQDPGRFNLREKVYNKLQHFFLFFWLTLILGLFKAAALVIFKNGLCIFFLITSVICSCFGNTKKHIKKFQAICSPTPRNNHCWHFIFVSSISLMSVVYCCMTLGRLVILPVFCFLLCKREIIAPISSGDNGG